MIDGLILLLSVLWWSWKLDPQKKLFLIVMTAALGQITISSLSYFLSLYPNEALSTKVLAPGIWTPFSDGLFYWNQISNLTQNGLQKISSHIPSILFVVPVFITSKDELTITINGIFFNGLVRILIIPTAFSLISNKSNALKCALFLALCPSPYLYASQLLRDPIIWEITLISVGLFFIVLKKINHENHCSNWVLGGWFASVYLLGITRIWAGAVFVVAAVYSILATKTKGILKKSFYVIGICIAFFFATISSNFSSPVNIIKNAGFAFVQSKDHVTETEKKENYSPQQQNILKIKKMPLGAMAGFCYLLLVIDLGIFCLLFLIQIKNGHIKNSQNFKFLLLFVGGIILISVIFENFSGNVPRYILPSILSLGFLFIEGSSHRNKSKN